jgi:hypothetical protein
MSRDHYSIFMENTMKRIIAGMLAIAVLAAPCAYDAFSPEPSPLTALFAMSTIFGKLQE